jgi:hypothetical protein
MIKHPTLDHLIELLYLWQTLTTGAFALTAAAAGVAAVVYQTQQAQRTENSRRNSRARALIAALPFSLNDINEYIRSSIFIITNAIEACYSLNEDIFRDRILNPMSGQNYSPFPWQAADKLIEIIDVSESDHGRPMIVLLQNLQRYDVTLEQVRRTAVGSDNTIFTGSLTMAQALDALVDSATLFAQCEQLFRYARGTGNEPASPIAADNVKAVLWNITPSFQGRDKFDERVRQRQEADSSWPQN